MCTLSSLAGVYSPRDNEGGVEIKFNLEAKRAGSPRVVKSSEDCCCFCQSSVDICFNISIALIIFNAVIIYWYCNMPFSSGNKALIKSRDLKFEYSFKTHCYFIVVRVQ